MQKNEKYNGWTNYATWRVNLEMFDYIAFVRDDVFGDSVADFADQLKGDAEQRIDESSDGENLAKDYAHAFISDVNWYEIASGINEGYQLGLKK